MKIYTNEEKRIQKLLKPERIPDATVEFYSKELEYTAFSNVLISFCNLLITSLILKKKDILNIMDVWS